MKKLISIYFILCLVLSAVAQDRDPQQMKTERVLRVYNWQDAQLPMTNCEIISMNGEPVLKIVNTNPPPRSYTEGQHPEASKVLLLKITDPSIAGKMDAISFDVKYEKVAGLNGDSYPYHPNQDVFPDDNIAFSLAGGYLHYEYAFFGLNCYTPPDVPGSDQITNTFLIQFGGTSNWQRFNFMHLAGKSENPPTQVELRIYLPAMGTVYVRSVKIFGVTKSWWSPQTAGLIGGIGGSLIGCFGALIGILAGMGKARRFVLSTTAILIVTGAFLVIGGIIAVAMKQPYAVWYPLLLGGAILTFVLSINLYSIKRRYDDLEIRRMTSMDAAGG